MVEKCWNNCWETFEKSVSFHNYWILILLISTRIHVTYVIICRVEGHIIHKANIRMHSFHVRSVTHTEVALAGQPCSRNRHIYFLPHFQDSPSETCSIQREGRCCCFVCLEAKYGKPTASSRGSNFNMTLHRFKFSEVLFQVTVTNFPIKVSDKKLAVILKN